MSDFNLRIATPCDNVQLLALDAAAPPIGYTPPVRPDFFHRGSLYSAARYWVVEDGATIVGVQGAALKRVRWAGDYVPTGFVFNARVHPEYRRRGLSMRLKEAAEHWVESNGAECSYVFVGIDNHINQALLRRRGYIPLTTFRFYAVAGAGAEVTPDDDIGAVGGRDALQRDVDAFYTRYDGVPQDRQRGLYETASGRYLGSWRLTADGGSAFGSVWDDEPGVPDPCETLFDLGWHGDCAVDCLRRLCRVLHRQRSPRRLIAVIDEQDKELCTALAPVASVLRTEIVAIKWFDRARPLRTPLYFDVRD